MPARQRRMAAQRDLDPRREPAQVVIGLAAFVGNQEGGFGEVVLGRDRLQRRVVEPLLERNHRGGISDRKSVVEGKRGYVRVDPGGRRILKTKHNTDTVLYATLTKDLY